VPEADASAPHLVVVDDDPQVVRIQCAILRSAGYHVEAAHSGADALALAEHGCDLLVSDVQMPGMDGLELARRMRQLVPGLRVLFCTGNPGCDARLAQHEVLRKPFKAGELLAAVDARLN